MPSPSLAELLKASGYTEFSGPVLGRAIAALYGNVGANLDARDWAKIMNSPNPLEMAEAALTAMYQDPAYLVRNTQHIVQNGYVAAQAEITYRQMAGRLGYTYNPAWSDGTPYDSLGDLTLDQLIAMVPPPPPPPPTLSLSTSSSGISAVLNVAGTLSASASGGLGNFDSGTTLLTEQPAVTQGFLSLAANGQTSASTSQYVTLGTSANDTLDLRGTGVRVDYAFAGAGNDEIRGGEGNDILFGAAGNDSLYGNENDDLIYGGAGNDSVNGGQGNDTIYGGDGDDYIEGGSAGDDVIIGGEGSDTLIGGTGADTIELTEAIAATDIVVLNQTASADTISQFGSTDVIWLSKAAYTALGVTNAALTANEFLAGAGTIAATTAAQRIIYNTTTGDLYYDADGSGVGSAAVLIASLSGAPTLTAAVNLYVIA